jgi:hypothetical protein
MQLLAAVNAAELKPYGFASVKALIINAAAISHTLTNLTGWKFLEYGHPVRRSLLLMYLEDCQRISMKIRCLDTAHCVSHLLF